jgi:hypothetical protein
MVLELDHLASEEERHQFIRKWRGEKEREKQNNSMTLLYIKIQAYLHTLKIDMKELINKIW